MQEPAALTFALTLKRWFRANGWPQKITDDWAKDPGVNYPHGPWASQVCGAMKADGYNPRAEFFIALAVFNKVVHEQAFKQAQGQTLKGRLDGSTAFLHDDGRLFTATDFWALFAGQLEPPAAYGSSPNELTQDDIDEWVKIVRMNFREVSLRHMVSRGEAWQMISDEMINIAGAHNGVVGPDDLVWVQEILCGLREPTLEECIRHGIRGDELGKPLQTALSNLLGERMRKKMNSIA